MPSTYIASEPMNTSTPMVDKTSPPTIRGRSVSPIPNVLEARAESPKTPEDVQRIPRDDSFKTCKAAAEQTPFTRREGLRKTPARMSIFSGGKPYKEGSSSGIKKFNSRRKTNTSQNRAANDTVNSNETFVKCEQELQFEGDSLEGPGSVTKRRDARPLGQQQLHDQEPLFESESEAVPVKPMASPKRSPIKTKKLSPMKSIPKPQSLQQLPKQKRSDQKMAASNDNNNINESKLKMPPPQQLPKPKLLQNRDQILARNKRQQNQARRESQAIRNQFLTPKLPTFRKPPASLIGTASRYMNSFNTSRLTRSTSFKSTAELERDYFSSLRSF